MSKIQDYIDSLETHPLSEPIRGIMREIDARLSALEAPSSSEDLPYKALLESAQKRIEVLEKAVSSGIDYSNRQSSKITDLSTENARVSDAVIRLQRENLERACVATDLRAVIQSMKADAELGRLVRAMPVKFGLINEGHNFPWEAHDETGRRFAHLTPEQSLCAAGVHVHPAKQHPCYEVKEGLASTSDFEEAVHQQAKAGVYPIKEDPRNDDGFPAEYLKQHGHDKTGAEG